MTKEMEELLISIKNIDKSILETYRHLANLEINNLKITEDYFQTLVKLNNQINLESELMTKLFSNIKDIFYLFPQLLKQITTEGDNISIIINNNEDKLIAFRITERIRNFLLKNGELINKLGIEEQFKHLGIDIEDSKDILENEALKSGGKELISLFQAAKSFQVDNDTLFLIILNKKIENEHNKRVKGELIRSKYNRIFTSSLVEKDLLNKAFNIPDDFYLNIYLTAKIYNIPENILDIIIKMNKKVIYQDAITMLIPKSHTYVSKTELELYLREIQIRTILSFYTPSEIQKVNEEFHNVVDDLNEAYFGDTIEAVTKAFKAYNYDKTLIKKVTLGG